MKPSKLALSYLLALLALPSVALFAPGHLGASSSPARPSGVPAEARFHKKARAWFLTRSGTRKVWYTSGQLKATGPMKARKRQGAWVFYHRSGKVRGRGSFRAGRLEGTWKLHYATGVLKSTGKFRDNYRTGKWVFFDKYGKKRGQGVFKNGYRHGAWTEYYSGGAVFYTGAYRKNKEHGAFKYYTAKGKVVQAGRFENGVRVGSWYICVAGQCGRKAFRSSKVPRRSGQVNPMGKKRSVSRSELLDIRDGKKRKRRGRRGGGW